MRFPSRLLLAMLIASPATIARAQAEPAPEQPPQAPAAPDDQAAPEDQAAAEDQAAPEDQANPSEPLSADVDAARVDESASVDGVPPWAFSLWCPVQDSGPSQRGWGVSRDHTAGVRQDGRTHEGTWSVVSASPGHVVLAVTIDLRRVQMDFWWRENNPSEGSMITGYMAYTRCGSINFNERF